MVTCCETNSCWLWHWRFFFFLFCLILLIKVHHPKSSSLRPDRVIIKEGSAGRIEVEVEVGVRGEEDGGCG